MVYKYNNEMYLDVEKVVLVMDNLNILELASLYKKYPPEETRRVIGKLEFHYTSKHDSWLDIAEIELNVMTNQCLSQWIKSIEILNEELCRTEKQIKQ